jgi:hypothetical protein
LKILSTLWKFYSVKLLSAKTANLDVTVLEQTKAVQSPSPKMGCWPLCCFVCTSLRKFAETAIGAASHFHWWTLQWLLNLSSASFDAFGKSFLIESRAIGSIFLPG